MRRNIPVSVVTLLYGNEPQLIEEKKREFLRSYMDLPLVMLNDESGPVRISEQLSEDSLFGDAKVFCLVNLPIIKKSGQKDSKEWDALYELLINYTGDNPVLLIYHDDIDKRIKRNNELLKKIPNTECKRLEGQELLYWLRNYCKSNGYIIFLDGLNYLAHMLELWQDVPVTFMKTEMDRYFLQLQDTKTIDAIFLEENSSDYGAKNIFTFKEALLKQDVPVLLELFPFMFGYKEIDRAMSYIEGQLRLQLMVSECRKAGMALRQIETLFKDNGSTTKAYPIKLAYEASPRIPIIALRQLLHGLYEIMTDNRRGKGDIWRFRDLCLTYCGYKG